jgi:hypothetical protein
VAGGILLSRSSSSWGTVVSGRSLTMITGGSFSFSERIVARRIRPRHIGRPGVRAASRMLAGTCWDGHVRRAGD